MESGMHFKSDKNSFAAGEKSRKLKEERKKGQAIRRSIDEE